MRQLPVDAVDGRRVALGGTSLTSVLLAGMWLDGVRAVKRGRAGVVRSTQFAQLLRPGTLGAFKCISDAVMRLRVRRAQVRRGFRTTAVWSVAPLGIAFSLLLIWSLPWVT